MTLPKHIDVSNAGQIREELLSVINRGAEALIADMTATISCDHVGAEAVARAWQRAVVTGTELRLVITSRIVSRVLSLSGLDRLVSTYPSLEAAMAASRTLAAVPAPAAATALPGTNGQGASRPAGGTTGQFAEAGPPDGNGSAIPPAVAWKLLDALPDGVALADGDGTIALAGRRLEEMFGYNHAELPGDLEDLARAAVTAEQEYRSRELLDTVVTSLFHVGLGLQTAMDLPADAARQRIAAALGQLDDTIREIRNAVYAARDHDTPAPHRSMTPGDATAPCQAPSRYPLTLQQPGLQSFQHGKRSVPVSSSPAKSRRRIANSLRTCGRNLATARHLATGPGDQGVRLPGQHPAENRAHPVRKVPGPVAYS